MSEADNTWRVTLDGTVHEVELDHGHGDSGSCDGGGDGGGGRD